MSEKRPCIRCWRPTAVANLVHGYGPECARMLGLVGATVDTGQDGPTLLDMLDQSSPETCLRATQTAETRPARNQVTPRPRQASTEALKRHGHPTVHTRPAHDHPHATISTVHPDLTWHKSSRCSHGACIEIARHDNDWLIRDSKHPDQPALRFTDAEWRAFHDGVTAGEFDFPR